MNDELRSWPMKGIEAPLANDVVYGRGGLANNHKGNKRFREMVCEFKDDYARCSRHEKTALAERLMQQWRNQSPPGRFIKMDSSSGLWCDVGDLKARGKVSQTLREGPLKTTPADQKEEQQAASTDSVTDEGIPPPPPPPPAPEVEEEPVTPPQVRPVKEQESISKSSNMDIGSPKSVMDMPFFPVEDKIVEEAGRKIRRSNSVISNFIEKIPGFRKNSKRVTSEDTTSASDCQPPSKRPAFQNPLASFLGNFIKDNGVDTVTIVEDNPLSTPDPTPVSRPVKTEVVHIEQNPKESPAAACPGNCGPSAGDYPVPPPRRTSTSSRRDSGRSGRKRVARNYNKSIPKELLMKPEPLDRSERSLSALSSISGGTMKDSLMEDLHELFRERCDTGTSDSSTCNSAIDYFRKAYPDAKPHQMFGQQQQFAATRTGQPQPFGANSLFNNNTKFHFGVPPPKPLSPTKFAQAADTYQFGVSSQFGNNDSMSHQPVHQQFACMPSLPQLSVPQPQPDPMDFDMMSLASFTDEEDCCEDPFGDYEDDSLDGGDSRQVVSFDNNTLAELMAG